MIRTDLLQGKMREKGFTIDSLAKEVGKSRTTLFNKIHNKAEFLVSEVQTIKQVLSLDENEATAIFFSQ